MSKMIKWYRNIEGYPKRTLRENIGDKIHATSAYEYKKEIEDIIKVDGNIKEFYNICSLYNKINTNNNIFANEILENIDSKFLLIVKDRQVGFSTTLAVIALYYTQVLDKSVVIVQPKVGNLLERLKRIYVSLPEHLKWGVKKLNKKEIRFNNGTSIRVSRSSIGYSPDLILVDEYDFMTIGDIEKILFQIKNRVGDKVIIGSTINNKRSVKYSMKDLIENKSVYGFKKIDITDIVNLRKQLIRDSKINDLLNS
jgi:hypothetical protein